MSELEIPERATKAYDKKYYSYRADDGLLVPLKAAALIIVATELRRLSQELIAEEDPNVIWRAIGRRANELDPPVVGK
jgi:hypothetical protein